MSRNLATCAACDSGRPDRTLLLTDAAANATDDTFVDIQISLGGS